MRVVSLFAALMLAVWLPAAALANEPYHETHEMHGVTGGAAWYVAPMGDSCTATACGTYEDRVTWGFTVVDSVETLIIEVTYDPVMPTSALRVDLICPEGSWDEAPTGCSFSSKGQEHLHIRVDRTEMEEEGLAFSGGWSLDVRVAEALGTGDAYGVDAGLALGQAYDLYLSVFHHAPAPDDFSAVPE